MTEDAPCIYVGHTQPRMLKGRHEADCEGDCDGCSPCPRSHCVDCYRNHSAGVCATCIGNMRNDLSAVLAMHDKLEREAIQRGYAGDRPGTVLGGDAMVMLAARYPDQNGQQAPDREHERASDPPDPLAILVGWEDVVRGIFGVTTASTVSVWAAVDYLGENLTMMAASADVPWVEFAHEVRQLRGRLEDVLHDGEREETGAPCPMCGGAKLVKRYRSKAAWDEWICPRTVCGERYSDAEYRAKVEGQYMDAATALHARHMARRTGAAEGSVRGWAAMTAEDGEPLVRRRGKDSDGLVLYDVDDVLAVMAGRRRRASAAS